jgi:cytochrome c oxidase subunit 2
MALAVALLIWFLAIVIFALFSFGHIGAINWFLPSLATDFKQIDNQFYLTFLITGIVFLLTHLLLGYVLLKYKDKNQKALHSLGNKRLEIVYAVVVTSIFVSLAVGSQKIWSRIYFSNPVNNDVLEVEVVAKQFEWQFRYPGLDKKFGKVDLELINKQHNPLGLDNKDPNSKDDIINPNELILPVNEPIKLIFRSQDVIHSFFVPNLRVKQDVVPGLSIPLQIKPTKLGDYEIACAELCGLGHYRMKGKLKIVTRVEFDKWLKENGENK